MRATDDIKQSIAAVTAPNEQLAITNELLIDIRTLLMAQLETKLETKLEGQAAVSGKSTPLHDVTVSNRSFHNRPTTDYYHLNAKAFDEHGDIPMGILSFSARTRSALDQMDIMFIHQFRHYRRRDIFQIRNSGKTTMKEIEDALEKYGIFLPE